MTTDCLLEIGCTQQFATFWLQDMERELKEIQDAMGAPIDVTCDCVGTRKSLTTSLEATRSAGRVCLVGMRESNMNLPIAGAAARYVFQMLITVNPCCRCFVVHIFPLLSLKTQLLPPVLTMILVY